MASIPEDGERHVLSLAARSTEHGSGVKLHLKVPRLRSHGDRG